MQYQNSRSQDLQKLNDTLQLVSSVALKKFKQAIRNKDYGDYFKFINSNVELGVVFGEFNSSYLKELGADHFSYKVIEPSEEISNKVKEKNINVFSVETIERSDGFKSSNVVALFPEMFVGNYKSKFSDPVFYFLDKFYERHINYTQNIIEQSDSQEYFLELKNLCLADFSNWVHLHEHFHRQGKMPIPEFLFEKGSPLGAAFEELRVDLKVMEYCLTSKGLYKTFLLVLSERMFLYPVIREKGSFDSIASLFLYNELIDIKCNDHMLGKIRELIISFEDIESEVVKLTSKVDRKMKLIKKLTPLFNVEDNYFFEERRNELI